MKRVLSLVLVLVLVLGSFPVFADVTDYGAELKALGLLSGDENGNLNPDQPLDRASMMVVLATYYGVLEDAQAFPLTSTFTDVDADAWYAPVVAYAQVEGWTAGYGDGTFGPTDAVTEQMAAAYMLRALGDADAWATAIEDAEAKGIATDATAGFTRANLFELMYETLNTENAEGVVLGTALGIDGFAPVAPEALEVVSVKALNLKEVEVVFNTEVDEDTAETAGDLFVTDHTAVGALQDDGTTVILTLADGDELDNQEVFTVEVDGVMSVDEALTLSDFVSDEVTAFDATVPEALSIALTAPDKFEITFSEPLDSAQAVTVEVEDGIYGVQAPTVDGNVVKVTLAASSLDEGDYAVEVSGAYDFAGFKALDKTFTLEYAEDVTAPVVSVDSADETEVVLMFDENVEFFDSNDVDLTATTDGTILDFFYHSYSSYNPDEVVVADDKVTLTFTTNPLPEGAVKFVMDVDAGDGYVQDEWSNAMESNLVVTLDIVVDDVAPVVTSIDVDTDAQNTIVVYFSEALDATSADTEANYTILDADGEEVTITSAVYSVTADDEYIVTITAEDMEGDYTIAFEDITDDSLLTNEIVAITKAFTKADDTAPVLTAITAEGIDGVVDDTASIIYVTFDDDMATSGTYSVLDKDNYLLGGAVLDDDDTIALFGGSSKVKITVADGAAVEGVELTIARVADDAGNKSVLLSDTETIGSVTAPVITAVKTVDDKTLEITVDQVLTTVVASGFVVADADSTGTFAAVSYSVNSDDETIIIGTLRAGEQLADPADVPVSLEVLADKIKADTGEYMANATTTTIADGYAPSLVTVADDITLTTAGTLVLEFDEAIATESYAAFDFEITVDGDALVAMTDFTVSTDGTTGVGIAITADLAVGDVVVVAIEAADYVADAAGNVVNDFDLALEVE